jgi:hypothetical protein
MTLDVTTGLVKLTRRRKYVEGQKSQIVVIHSTLAIRRVSINKTHHNKTHHNKTLHLAVEISQALIEGLVDIRASISIMAASELESLA